MLRFQYVSNSVAFNQETAFRLSFQVHFIHPFHFSFLFFFSPYGLCCSGNPKSIYLKPKIVSSFRGKRRRI